LNIIAFLDGPAPPLDEAHDEQPNRRNQQAAYHDHAEYCEPEEAPGHAPDRRAMGTPSGGGLGAMANGAMDAV
jgi:hypothetical protein